MNEHAGKGFRRAERSIEAARRQLAAFRERQDATYELEPEITNDQAIDSDRPC